MQRPSVPLDGRRGAVERGRVSRSGVRGEAARVFRGRALRRGAEGRQDGGPDEVGTYEPRMRGEAAGAAAAAADCDAAAGDERRVAEEEEWGEEE